jgi:hypothetical protein
VAIRPGSIKPSPQAHLPDYFTRKTKTLQDGTVVVQESMADREEQERVAKKYELHDTKSKPKTNKAEKNAQAPVRAPPVEPAEQQSSGAKVQPTEEQLAMLHIIKKQAAEQAWGVDHPDPLAKNPLPISRAERRKLIKEEIQRLAQADKPVYYQRRLW